MSETSKVIKKKTPRATVNKNPETDIGNFKIWLGNFTSSPKLHVNGSAYANVAVITVDFGSPLDESTRLTGEQHADLAAKMKFITRGILGKPDVNVRVQNDSNGVFWTFV